jgi:hypothetical protein
MTPRPSPLVNLLSLKRLISAGNINTSSNNSLNDRLQKFNNPAVRQGPLPLSSSNSLKKSQSEYPVRQSQPKKVEESEIVKGDTPAANNRLSNKPSQSIPIVEGVASVKDRMKFLTEKKEFVKENLAAKEIKMAGASGVKDLAGTLSNLGLFAPKMPVEENQLEQIPETGTGMENSQGIGSEEKKTEEVQPKPIIEDNSSVNLNFEGV